MLIFIGLVEVTFAQDSPTIVVVVLLGAVYTLTSDVPTPTAWAFLNAFAMLLS
jgi:hypothetical protein